LYVESGWIGPLAIEQVKPRTLEKVKRILKQRSAVGETQMKLPRVVWDMNSLVSLKTAPYSYIMCCPDMQLDKHKNSM